MVDEETAEEDSEAFDCETCPVADALADLDGPNSEAWEFYKKVVTRLSADLYMGGVVLGSLTKGMDPDDFDDLWRRLTILYNALNPPRKD